LGVRSPFKNGQKACAVLGGNKKIPEKIQNLLKSLRFASEKIDIYSKKKFDWASNPPAKSVKKLALCWGEMTIYPIGCKIC
jgi:hypothetical protein